MVTTRRPKTIVKPTALGPVANTDTKLLIYGLFQKGRVLAQDGMPRSRAETWVQARAAPGPERASPLRRGSPGLGSRSSRDESANKRRNHAGMVPADRRLVKFGARG